MPTFRRSTSCSRASFRARTSTARSPGRAIILTGSVRTPIDSDRAAQIAAQFAPPTPERSAQRDRARSSTQSTTTSTSTTSNFSAGGATSAYSSQTQADSHGGAGSDDPYAAKPIINLLSVEGEEQVMLRVTVAEVQRSMLKQFGINLGALLNSGNFTTAILSRQRLPAHRRRGPRHAADGWNRCTARCQLFNQRPDGPA